MNVTVSERDGVPVARVVGDVDLSNCDELGEALRAAVPNTALGLVLDLRETTYLDSTGMALLFEVVQRLRHRQQSLHVVIPPDSFVDDMVFITDLGSYATVHLDPEAAVAELVAAA